METQLLIYQNVSPVSKANHSDLSIKAGVDYSFSKEVNSVPLMAVEFLKAAREYAVVFTGSGEEVMPAVILGTRNKENLYYNDEGSWKADYIPAFLRRYPFVFSSSDQGGSFTLCIDESFSGCNRDGKGERLFDADGEQTQYLTNILEFLKEYQAHFHRTQLFCKKLVEYDLLEPMGAQFTSPEGEKRSLTGFLAVNRDKLKALSPDQLSELVKTDWLELVYAHVHSLENFKAMMSLVKSTEPSEAA